MNHIKQSETQATFLVADLKAEMGEDQAEQFLRSYRHACHVTDSKKEEITINCADLNQLIARYKSDQFQG